MEKQSSRKHSVEKVRDSSREILTLPKIEVNKKRLAINMNFEKMVARSKMYRDLSGSPEYNPNFESI